MRRWAVWEGVVLFGVPGAASILSSAPRLRQQGLVWAYSERGVRIFSGLSTTFVDQQHGMARSAWAGGRPGLQAVRGSALLSADCRLLGPWWSTSAVTWIIGCTQSLPSATETCIAIIRSSKHRPLTGPRFSDSENCWWARLSQSLSEVRS